MTSDKNCLSWWYPQIVGKVPTPKTEIIQLSKDEVISLTEAAYEGIAVNKTIGGLAAKLAEAGRKVSENGPWFLRTGQTSGKHQWKHTCFITDLDKMAFNVGMINEFSAMADIMGLAVDVWAIREYLPVKPLFRCRAYGDMPFVPEWRVFVGKNGIEKVIPYWPEDAIEKGRPDNEDWELIYHAAYHDWPDGIAYAIGGLAMDAFKCLDDQEEPFSVDVLWSEGDQRFYVTDMALAAMSWGRG